MNKTQKENLEFAVAQIELDSGKVLPGCCREHDRMAFGALNLFSVDAKDIPDYQKYVDEMICLN